MGKQHVGYARLHDACDRIVEGKRRFGEERELERERRQNRDRDREKESRLGILNGCSSEFRTKSKNDQCTPKSVQSTSSFPLLRWSARGGTGRVEFW